MRAAIIIDPGSNNSLLRFTETKLFFDAKNQSRDLVDDCFTVATKDQARALATTLTEFKTIFIIESGYFLTSTFAEKYKATQGILMVEETEGLVIKYDSDTYIGFDKRCKYPPASKQLYIVENMLKSCLVAKKSIYFENTEELPKSVPRVDHLYGLASGWKTLHLAKSIGFENLKSITVYDVNLLQLAYAQRLHQNPTIPFGVDDCKNKIGTYSVPDWLDNAMWSRWHNYPIQFKQIDLFQTPKFPPNSLVWISNVFKFEPTLFQYGWKRVKEAKKILHNENKDAIIITT